MSHQKCYAEQRSDWNTVTPKKDFPNYTQLRL